MWHMVIEYIVTKIEGTGKIGFFMVRLQTQQREFSWDFSASKEETPVFLQM